MLIYKRKEMIKMEFTDRLSQEDFDIELRGMLKLMTFESKLPYIVFFDFENRVKRENKISRIFISINSVFNFYLIC